MVSLPPIVAAVRRRRHGGFNLRTAFFGAGEPGGVYDPSDLTAEKVAWRRNLLTWSEDFTNAAWTKITSGVGVAPVVTANAGLAPNGTMTADRVQFDCTNTGSASNRSIVQQAVTLTIGVTYTRFVSLKAWDAGNIGRTVRVSSDGMSGGATVTLTADWQTVTLTGVALGTSGALLIETRGTITTQTADVLMWGAQFEQSPTATAYQRITDFTSDFLAAFPTHGLYQDAAGTTPVTALGQPVGLVIDSKTGGISTTSLIGNGAIGIVGTATAATYNTTTGVGTCNRVDASNQSFVQWSGLNNASSYRVTLTNTGAVTLSLRAGGQTGSILGSISVGATTQLVGLPSAGLLTITAAGAGGAFTVLAFNEVPGVHAIQATNSSRPLLDGRVNLLTFSEQFDNAAWTKLGSSVTANATTAPDGTATADRLVEDTGSGTHQVRQDVVTAAASYSFSVYAKADTRSWLLLYNTTAGYVRTFNLATGQIGTASNGTSVATIEAVGNGWYRCTLTGTATAASNAFRIYLNTADDVNATYVGDGTSGAFIWGADLRLAADNAYPYQRVAAATDYADVGVPRSFAFDGFDDSLYTASNMDLSGTDKVTVLAGVRKLSDAAAGCFYELGSGSGANNGTFYSFTPSTAPNPTYQSGSKGTLPTAATYNNAAIASPSTFAATHLADIAGDLVVLRVNGAQVAISTGDQGTGNYGTYVFNIGRRNNASLPFNGKAYQLIVRGALTDAATLAQAERYVGAKTGIYL